MQSVIEISRPVASINASLALPGSKSISNRLLIIKHLLRQPCTIENISDADDTRLLIDALRDIDAGKMFLNTGDAGTVFRFLTAFLSITKGEWQLDGSKRMRERPVGPLVDALRSLGAQIDYRDRNGYPPLLIRGKNIAGGTVTVDASTSSQFVSALLLVAPVLQRGLRIHLEKKTVSSSYFRLTAQMLSDFGMDIKVSGPEIVCSPMNMRLPEVYLVESDWSAASYWYSICALSHDTRITLKFLDEKSAQPDRVVVALYERLGVRSQFAGRSVTLHPTNMRQESFDHDFTECPDLAQTIAFTMAGCGITGSLRGLKTLRIKETDRIAAMAAELRRCGCTIDATEDSLTIVRAGCASPGSPFLAYGDHRMAMSIAPLCMKLQSLFIDDASVVSKSYPRFWDHLRTAGFRLILTP